MSAERDQAILAAISRGEAAQAEKLAEEYLAAGGGGDALYLLGLARARQGDAEGARRLVARAAELRPGRADIAYNLGVLLREAGDAAGAVAQWCRVLGLEPERRDALGNLALLLGELGKADEAKRCWETLLARWPDDRDALYNHANLLLRQGRNGPAQALYERLVEHYPNHVQGWINLGMLHKRAGRLRLAERSYRVALAVAPDSALAHFNLANLLLARGDWREGLAEYEWRRLLPDAGRSPVNLPEWRGTEPAGCRVLIWADQGFGDAIQFLRHVPRLAARGQRCHLVVPVALAGLAGTLPDVESVTGPDDPLPAADVQLALGSLPFCLGESEPGGWTGPYLAAPADAPEPPPALAGAIGLVWAGSPSHANDRQRSMGLEALAPLLDLAGTRWAALQTGIRAGDAAASPLAGRFAADPGAGLGDFGATARVLQRLSLLITVDTAAAHLAGAMGRPAWVMLPAQDCDWRWGLEGDRTPLYPSLRLFRQPRPGDWTSVVAEIAAALKSEGLAG